MQSKFLKFHPHSIGTHTEKKKTKKQKNDPGKLPESDNSMLRGAWLEKSNTPSCTSYKEKEINTYTS